MCCVQCYRPWGWWPTSSEGGWERSSTAVTTPSQSRSPRDRWQRNRIRIQHFTSLRIRSLSGPGFRELSNEDYWGIVDQGLLQQKRFYNIPRHAMHWIRISNEDPDPGEPNQGRYAWTRNIVRNFLKSLYKKAGCNKTMLCTVSNSVTKLCAFFL